MWSRHNESTVEKLNTLLGPSRLTVGDDDVVHFNGKDWLPQGKGLDELADGTNRLVFLTGSDGRRYVATDGTTYQLLDRTETLPFNLIVLLVFAVPALTALAVPLATAVRRLRHRPPGRPPDGASHADSRPVPPCWAWCSCSAWRWS